MKGNALMRYSQEEISNAVARIRAGESISAVARELHASKSTVSRWIRQSEHLPSAVSTKPISSKQAIRARKFVDRAWASIKLAFNKLNQELQKDKPQGIRDLALLLAILSDKMRQAAETLESRGQSGRAEWEASSETLLVLQRYKESRTTSTPPPTPPAEAPQPNLGVPGLEPQKPEDAPPTPAGEAKVP